MESDRPDDEGFAEGDSPDDEIMDTNLGAEGDDEMLNGPASLYYAVPVSPTEVEEQGKDFSKEEVEEMMKSEPYQKKLATCHLCRQCWYEGTFTPSCPECGGYPLQRPCLVCNGRCNQIWQKNVKKTHSFHKAHWEGKCLLSLEVQQALMQQTSTEQSIAAGMQDLSTR